MTPDLALPEPVMLGDLVAVPIDIQRVDARVHFDVASRVAEVEATAEFVLGHWDGCPILDLRQPLERVLLDGAALPAETLSPRDLGAGPGTEMRVLERPLDAGTAHRLELRYRLETPAAAGAVPLSWGEEGIGWDLWMSDLNPGRYLEMWLPANLCHDRFALQLEVAVHGGRPHRLLTNGAERAVAPNRWSIDFPGSFTSLSPMVVLRPEDEIAVRHLGAGPGELVTAKVAEAEADLAGCEADVAAWLDYNRARYGPFVHGPRFTCVLWGPGRGMEYDGATTASIEAVEHEVFHSWFGRGVKPWRASDGWIDEAWTSWATNSRRREAGRYAVERLDLDQPPVVLYPPHPWSRHTPLESYREGARLFAGVAYLLGGATQMRSAMAEWYRAHAGGFVTTDCLERHLVERAAGVSPLFRRYVHGVA